MLSQPLFKVATYLSYGMVEVTEFTLTVKQKQNRSNRYPSSRGLILNRASKAHAAARAFRPEKTPTPVHTRALPTPPPPPPPVFPAQKPPRRLFTPERSQLRLCPYSRTALASRSETPTVWAKA